MNVDTKPKVKRQKVTYRTLSEEEKKKLLIEKDKRNTQAATD